MTWLDLSQRHGWDSSDAPDPARPLSVLPTGTQAQGPEGPEKRPFLLKT